MKILVGSIPMPMNRFLVDLNQALAAEHDLTHDPDVFWQMRGDFDVVHLHFPEYLTYEVQGSYKTGLTDDLIAATEERLRYWSTHARIVVTRHVLLPHDALHDPQWEKMYETFYRYARGVVHFAQASVDEFQHRYGDTDFVHGRPAHEIVPHHHYGSLPNQVTRDEARRRLGIADDRKVMLVFGSIRNDQEASLILNTFQNLRMKKKLLLVSNWRETLPNVSWIRLKYWIRDAKRWFYRWHLGYCFNYGFVQEEDTQLYLNAADVLFIPRFKVLNSGNVTLGMTFGKVVVGPDSGDVGELLTSRNHPVFDPDDPETAVDAVQYAFKLAAETMIGGESQQFALQNWSPEQCGERYVVFFKRLEATGDVI